MIDQRTRPGRVGLLGLLALATLAGAALFVVLRAGDAGAPTLQRVQEAGVVRVGYANEAPFAYLDPGSGELVGEAPAVAREVLERMGIERVEGVLTEFSSLIPGLRAGHFDLVAAGMYVTPERCERVAFSEPTYCVHEAFMVRAGNPLDLHAYEDVVAHTTARLGVVGGTVELGYAEALGMPSERVVVFPDAPSAMAGLQAQRIDAYGGTSLTLQSLLDTRPVADVERAVPFRDPVIDGEVALGCGAFAFRPDDEAFRAEFERHLADFLGTEAHADLVRPFGFTERERRVEVTTAELCRE